MIIMYHNILIKEKKQIVQAKTFNSKVERVKCMFEVCHLFRVTARFVLMAVSSALLILTAALGGGATRLGGGGWGGG